MTKEEAIRQLEGQINPNNPMIASIEAISMAVKALEQEKEPAPSEAVTSSEKNYPTNNDTAQSEICQEEITVPEELSEDLFQLMIDCIRNMIMVCVRHGIYDMKEISRVVYATIKTSLKVFFFEHEEDKHDRH